MGDGTYYSGVEMEKLCLYLNDRKEKSLLYKVARVKNFTLKDFRDWTLWGNIEMVVVSKDRLGFFVRS